MVRLPPQPEGEGSEEDLWSGISVDADGDSTDLEALSARRSPEQSRVPPLNLQGLPPPVSYQAWPVLARFWWADSLQAPRAPRSTRQSRVVPPLNLQGLPPPVAYQVLVQASQRTARRLPTQPWDPADGRSQQCAICLSDFEKNCSVSWLQCSHVFHEDCISRWVSAQAHCPLCRAPC